MENNKIQTRDGTVLLDLTQDTVTADKLASGYTAHDASGEIITGTGAGFDGMDVKKLEYTGDGQATNALTFPAKPTMILQAFGKGESDNIRAQWLPVNYGSAYILGVRRDISSYDSSESGIFHVGAAYSGSTMTVTGANAGDVMNVNGENYAIYYVGADKPAKTLGVDFEHPVHEGYGWGTAGIDETYTAETAGVYLVLNIETVGEAGNTHRSGATVTTTGNAVAEDTQSTDFVDTQGSSRDTVCVIELIQLEAGDTITMTNNHTNGYAAQIHLIFPTNYTEGQTLVNGLYEFTWSRSGNDNSAVYVNTGGDTYCIALEMITVSGGAASQGGSITGAEEISKYYEQHDAHITIMIGEYYLENGSTMTLVTNPMADYGTHGKAVWRIE